MRSSPSPGVQRPRYILTRDAPLSDALDRFRRETPDVQRFQAALDVLLPIAQSQSDSPLIRLAAAYLLIALYAPHTLDLNPFLAPVQDAHRLARSKAQTGTEEVRCEAWALGRLLQGEVEDLGRRSLDELLDDWRAVGDEISYSRPGTPVPAPTTEHDPSSPALSLLHTATHRTLTLSESRALLSLPHPPIPVPPSLPQLIALNPHIAPHILLPLLPASPAHLSPLCTLPPTRASFEVLGKLLRSRARAGNVVRTAVLGPFLASAVDGVEGMRREDEADGGDRLVRGVRMLCVFFLALLEDGLIGSASDPEAVEMFHFSLRYARFSDAQRLYQTLATATS